MNRSWMVIIFSSHSSSEGKQRGTGGGEGSRLLRMFTKRVMFASASCSENGSFEASFMMSRGEQIMISHLNGNFFANALRRVDSRTFSRTTNVPTAPMLTTPNLANSFASCAGRQRLAPPTFTARRKTTQDIQ